jgi:O-antigen ligase
MPVFTLFILFTFIYEGDFSGFDSLVLIRFENLENDESLLVRYEIYKAAEQIITEHPLVGIGYGQFTKYNPLNALFSDKMQGIVTHNDYIRIITELGIVGAILFLIMTITIFKKTFKIPKLFKELCLSLLVMTLFFSASHNNLNSFMFWLILFLPIIIYNLRSKTHEYKAIA